MYIWSSITYKREILIVSNYFFMNRIYSISRLLLCVIVLIFISITAEINGQSVSSWKISFLFIGDIMGHDEQIWSAEDRETHTYNYDDVFKYIKPVISEADIAIANFEVTLDGAPYMGYPQFSSPAALATACKNAGIDYLVSANNHAADRGKSGILGTINRLDSIGIPHTGTFRDSIARDTLYPLMIRKSGASIALLNYTYGTNGIKVPQPVIVNILDKDLITNDVRKAKNKGADIVILFLHWGTEYDTIPARSQTELAEYFFSIGVDLVIGSHPHVLQKMVWQKNISGGKDGIVVYSMGNFVSNQRKPKTDGGSIVRIEFTKNESRYKISNAGYYLTWVYTPIEKYRKHFFILPGSEFEDKPDFFNKADDYLLMKKFINDSRELLDKQNLNIKEYIYKNNTWLLKN
jgi:poly-gamma-glutamate capsule biosynthesis protein CapA/YwtB (metallophosphatase superfamily)